MDCSSEDAHRSDISNWNRARDPRTLSPLSSPTMDSSASSIEDAESQVSEEIDTLAKTNEETWSTSDDEYRMRLFEATGVDEGVYGVFEYV
ncbi:unnamed protein product [Arctogadus glacialis]